MELTIGTANFLRESFVNILNRSTDVLLSTVIRCNLFTNIEKLNTSLKGFDTVRQDLVKKYCDETGKIEQYIEDKDGNTVLNDNFVFVEKELNELAEQKINVELETMSFTYSEAMQRIAQVDIPVTQRELSLLSFVCSSEEYEEGSK